MSNTFGSFISYDTSAGDAHTKSTKLSRASSNVSLNSSNSTSTNTSGNTSLSSFLVTNLPFIIRTTPQAQIKFLVKYIFTMLCIITVFELGYYYKRCPNAGMELHQVNGQSYLIIKQNNLTNHTVHLLPVAVNPNEKFTRLVDYESNSSVLEEQKQDSLHQKHVTDYLDMFESIRGVQLNLYESLNISVHQCPAEPPNLEGTLNLDVLFQNNTLASMIQFYEKINVVPAPGVHKAATTPKPVNNTMLALSNDLSLLNGDVYGDNVQLGGHWEPSTCTSRYRLGVIIPYRNRFVHLAVLLRHLHFVLQRQQIAYRIFVTEQAGNVSQPFNKGRIMNAAFIEALKIDSKIDCFVFHDVDLVPEDDRNIYSCPQTPRHMSVAIDKFGYQLPYRILIGGVFILKKQHFLAMNGYSNAYWGWGAEDDDMYERLVSNKLTLNRPPTKYARYRMVKHESGKLNPERHKMLRTAVKRYKTDGVNTVNYKLLNTTLYTAFTHFAFNIGQRR